MVISNWRAVVVASVFLTACGDRSDEGAAPSPPVPSAIAVPSTTLAPQANQDQWIGRWNGPEGTYLLIAKDAERYTVEIADLDGPRRYEAVSVGEGLQFERGGKTELIRASSGEQTGMKWLQDKRNCLTINAGEGFCRD